MKHHNKGFTIVELVTVMVVVGVLAAILIPRMMGTSWASTTYRQEVLSALRYAQKTAVSHRRLVCANVAGANVTLQIAQDSGANACGLNMPSPDGRPYASQNASVVAGGSMSGMLLFQPDGRVMRLVAGNPVVSTGTITITGEASITIHGETGYVQ
ncbi:prepilin-type N-terminal cleavage/methylation domain-containing protein [Massilia sp. SR12]